MIDVRRYRQADGFEPLTDWLKRLPDRQAKARLLARIDRLETGNFGDCKFLRDGVSELRIDQSLFHQYPRDALSPEKSRARRPVKAIVTLLPRRATLQSAFPGGNPPGRGHFRPFRCRPPLQYRHIAAVVLLELDGNDLRRTRGY